MFDFSKVEAATASSYLEPGIYKVRVKEAKSAPSKQKQTPGIAVTLEAKDGLSVTENFYVTEETQERLQYLHQAWLGKKLEGKFKSADEVVAYFVKTLNANKKILHVVIVGGQIADNGNLYSKLPYTFVVEDESSVEIGPFDTDSKEYKKYVTTSNLKSEVAGKKNGILNTDETEEEEIGSKKSKTADKPKAKETAKPVAGKKGKKVEDEESEEAPEEEAEDNDDDGDGKLDW
jgi:hypothetical protein